MGNKLGLFVAGSLVGAAAAYFTSPRSGFENRNLAKDAIHALIDTAAPAPAGAAAADGAAPAPQTAAEKGQEFLKAAAEKGQEFYATANSKVQEVVKGATATVASATGASTSESDELRQKIEAARQRIAAQVVKNAEEAQLVDVEAAEEVVAEAVVAEAVEEA